MEMDRVKREKEWHNKTFGTDVRANIVHVFVVISRLLVIDL
jgi:hypothetical protein